MEKSLFPFHFITIHSTSFNHSVIHPHHSFIHSFVRVFKIRLMAAINLHCVLHCTDLDFNAVHMNWCVRVSVNYGWVECLVCERVSVCLCISISNNANYSMSRTKCEYVYQSCSVNAAESIRPLTHSPQNGWMVGWMWMNV